jgi:signal transduction histidine kinase
MPTERPSILYVDDEQINLKVFEANFKNRFNVITCLGGAAAIEALRARPGEVAVVLTDQRMPQMTGVELLEKVKVEFPDIQRMLVTAYSDMQAVTDSVNRGQISRYFVKPWNRDDLAAALEDGLRIFELQLRLRDVEVRMLRSERLAAIGQVSAGIAHELMNPVSYLTQNVITLRGELKELNDWARPVLATAPNARLTELLDELPELMSDVEQGAQLVRTLALGVRTQARGEDKADSCELSEVALFASKLARAEVRQRAEMTIRGPTVKVFGGQVKLTQVLLNLVVNAAQAMDGLGRRGTIEVGWEDLGAEGAKMWVKDNGAGIPVELQERVFEPLFTTRPIGVGTGLGLAICRDLMRSVGGEITLKSQVGVGTTIELKFRPPDGAKAVQAG